MRIMGVDPGGTTGVVVWTDERKESEQDKTGGYMLHYEQIKPSMALWRALEIPGKYQPKDWRAGDYMVTMKLMGLIDEWAVDVVAYEDFVLREGERHTGDRAAMSPVRLCAQFDALVRVLDNPPLVVWQQAALAKTTMTDARLKALGLWIPGQQHARDAARHAVTAYRSLRSKGKLSVVK